MKRISPRDRLRYRFDNESARRRDETAVGYRLHVQAHMPAQSYGVVLDPDKTLTRTLDGLDEVIVLADS